MDRQTNSYVRGLTHQNKLTLTVKGIKCHERKNRIRQSLSSVVINYKRLTGRQTDRLTVLLEEKHQRIITDLYCSGLRVSYHYYITVRWHHLYGVCRSKYYHLWEPTALFVIILKIKFSLTWPKQLYMAAASMVYLFYALRPWGVTITFYPQNRINKIYSLENVTNPRKYSYPYCVF